MSKIVQNVNGKEIDMTSVINRQMAGELTREQVLKIIENNKK